MLWGDATIDVVIVYAGETQSPHAREMQQATCQNTTPSPSSPIEKSNFYANATINTQHMLWEDATIDVVIIYAGEIQDATSDMAK